MLIKFIVILAACISSAKAIALNSTALNNVFQQAASIIAEGSRRVMKYVGRISHLMYPSTNYCGYGNVARRFNDLGDDPKVDMCCRAHDYCYQNIMPKEHKFNLTNQQYFTSLHCDCDYAFKQCLKSINNRNANIVGNIYFNLLGHMRRCFDKRYPVVKCTRNVTKFMYNRCVEYEYNTTHHRRYQWFDLPVFD